MTDNDEPLIRCSRCKCNLLSKFFSINVKTEQRLKTCMKCRECGKKKCDECEYKGSVRELKLHMKTDHPRYICRYCDAVYYDIDSLEYHYSKNTYYAECSDI